MAVTCRHVWCTRTLYLTYHCFVFMQWTFYNICLISNTATHKNSDVFRYCNIIWKITADVGKHVDAIQLGRTSLSNRRNPKNGRQMEVKGHGKAWVQGTARVGLVSICHLPALTRLWRNTHAQARMYTLAFLDAHIHYSDFIWLSHKQRRYSCGGWACMVIVIQTTQPCIYMPGM